MKKTQNNARWLKFLSLIVAFIALAVPDVSAYTVKIRGDFPGSGGWNGGWHTLTDKGSNIFEYKIVNPTNATCYFRVQIDGAEYCTHDGNNYNVDSSPYGFSGHTGESGCFTVTGKGTIYVQVNASTKYVWRQHQDNNVSLSLYGSFNHGTTSWTSTLVGTQNVSCDGENEYTYEYNCTSSNPFLFRVDMSGLKYGATEDKTALTSTKKTLDQNDSKCFQVESPGAGGKIIIHVIPSTLQVWATTEAAGPTLSKVYLSSNNGSSWTKVENNSTITTINNPTSDNKFIVKSVWSDGSTYYYTFNGAPTSTGNKTLTTGSTTQPDGVALDASNVSSVKMKVNVTSQSDASINITELNTYPDMYMFLTDPLTNLGKLTREGSVYTLSGVELEANKHVLMSGQSTTAWGDINGNRYSPADKSSHDIPAADLSVGYFTSDPGGAWKATQTGTYTFTFDYSTMELTATCVSVTLTSVRLSKDNGVNWSDVTNNSTVIEYSYIAGSEQFLVETTWSDASTVYFTFDGHPKTEGTKNLIVTTSSGGTNLDTEVLAANMLVNVTSKTAATITLSGVTMNEWTFTPANNTVTTEKEFLVSKTNSRGTKVSYGRAAIDAAGSYELTEGVTSSVVINIDNPSTTIIWTAGVPTLQVRDLNATIVKVELYNKNNTLIAELTKHVDGSDIYFTWEGKTGNIGNSQSNDNQYYLKSTDSYSNTIIWALNAAGDTWYLNETGSTGETLVQTSSKYIGFNEGDDSWETTYSSIKVTLSSSNYLVLDKIYRTKYVVKAVGGLVGTGYSEGAGIPMYLYGYNASNNPLYTLDCGFKTGDQYCRFFDRWVEKGGSSNDQVLGTSAASASSWQDSNSNAFKLPIGSSEQSIQLWACQAEGKVWYEATEVIGAPNFKMKDHEYDHVFITAPYLNDSKLAPDWEMSTKDGETYTLKNVTLRGADAVAPELTAVVLDKTTWARTTYTWTPKAGLESRGDRQVGRSFDLTFTKANGETPAALTGTAHTDKSIPFISLVGYQYQQSSNENTPHAGNNTNRGWQESWILYDENGDPFRDNDGNYMYNTQWPPKNPVQFAGVVNASDRSQDIEMSSDNLTFAPQKSDGSIMVKTGSKWNTELSDKAYDKLFSTRSSAPKRESGVVGPMSGSSTLDGETNYIHYVAKNVWLLGATKVWTGWGTQLNGEGKAEWNDHMNWGITYTDDKNYNGDDSSGVKINAGEGYTMGENTGNFMFSSPTFFKTVDLFIETDASGVPNLDANPIFYTTLGKGDPSILARSAKLAGSEKVPNTGTFFAAYDTGKLPTGTTISKVVITRYDGNESSSDNDPSNWKKLAVVKTYTGTDLDDLTGNNSYRSEVDNASAVWFTETEALSNGRYFYGMALYDGSDNLIEQVASNTFSIANIDITPSVNALQLLELTANGANLVDTGKGIIANFTKDAEDGYHWYLTYQPDNAGKFFIVEERTNKVFEIEKEYAMKAINAYEVVWTTRYFVRAGNVSSYNATMTAQKNKGIISHFTTPTYSVSYVDIEGITQNVPQTSMVQSSNGTVGFVTNFTEGMLDKFTFQSSLTYKVTPTGETQLSYTNNGSKPVLPYVPGAYKLSYTYESDLTDAAAFGDVTMTTTSSIIAKNAEGKPTVGNLDGTVPTANAHEKTMSVKGLKYRDLNCVFKFARPNVSKAILDNYDIFYDLWLNNNDPEKDIFKDRIFVDDATNNTQGEKFYKVTVHQVSPANDIYPEMAIKGTVYIPHGKLSEIEGFGEYSDFTSLTDDQKAKVATEVERVRMVTETSIDSKFQMYHTPAYEVRKLPLKNNADAETASDWYTGSVLYCEGINTNSYDGEPLATLTLEAEVEWIQPTPGKFVRQISYKLKNKASLSMSDTGDIIHTPTTGAPVFVKPSYYDIETYVPGKVSNLSLDASNNITGTNYYDKAGMFVVTKDEYKEGVFNLSSITNDDLYVAKNFVHEPNTNPATFIITPIYIFRRQPAAAVDAPTASQIGLILIGNNVADQYDTNEGEAPVAAASAPRRASGSSGMASSVNSVGDVEYVVMRGSAAINDTAGVGDGVWTSVEMVEDSGLLTIGRGRIAIDGAKSARIFNMSGINVGEGNGVHYVEPGIYTVILNGNPRKVVVK